MSQEKQPLELLKNHHDRFGHGDSKPEYTFVSSVQGFTATCHYKGRKTNATSRSKKDAQRQAASDMLNLLETSRSKPIQEDYGIRLSKAIEISPTQSESCHNRLTKLTECENVKASSFIEMFHDVKGFDSTKNVRINGEILDDVNVGFKRENGPKSSLLKLCEKNYTDAIDHFRAVMEEMNLKFYCKIAEVKEEKDIHVIFLSIALNGIMTAGCGTTINEAVYDACNSMINALLILTE